MRRPAAMLLLVASVLLHWPLGVAEFSFDDLDFVQVNASIRSLPDAWGAMLGPFPPDQPERALYRPLTNLSYAFDYALSGDDARGFHSTNVLLYLAVVLLVQRLVLAYLGSPGLAFGAALLFSIHPVHTGAVDSIAGRSELLALLFGLVSILLFLRAVRGDRGAGWALAGSLVSYALACLSKETGAVLPGVLAFHLALFHPPRGDAGRAQRDRALRFLIPFAFVLGAYVAVRYLALGRFSPEQLVLAGEPLGVRLLTMGAVFFEYLRLLVFPGVLQVDFYYHDTIGIPSEPTAASLFGLLSLLAILGSLVWLVARQLRSGPAETDASSRRPILIVALAIFLVFLFPVSHVLDIGALMAERFLLAPSLGFVILVVIGTDEGLRRLIAEPSRRLGIAMLMLGVITLAGGVRSALRAAEWRDNVRLWQATAEAIPWDSRAQLNLGTAQMARGELDAAELSFERALGIDPGSAHALGNLGAIALHRGEYEAARGRFRRHVELAPGDYIAWNNLGLAEANLLQHTLAKRHYEQALQLNPNYVPAQQNLLESERLIGEARRFLAAQRAAAAESQDPVLLQTLSAACTVIDDVACAEHFAARAAQAQQP